MTQNDPELSMPHDVCDCQGLRYAPTERHGFQKTQHTNPTHTNMVFSTEYTLNWINLLPNRYHRFDKQSPKPT